MLKLGSRGDAVAVLQSTLNQVLTHIKSLRVTGYYDSLTESHVRSFQRSTGKLKIDGVYGPKTDKALIEAYKRSPAATAWTMKPMATASKSRVPQTATPKLASMTVAQREALIIGHASNSAALMKFLGKQGVNNVAKWIGHVNDMVRALNVIGSLVSVANSLYGGISAVSLSAGTNAVGVGAVSSASFIGVGSILAGASGLFANVLFLFKCAHTISSIYGNAMKTYALRGAAYAMTSFFFDKPQVRGSKTITSHSSEQAGYRQAWRKAQSEMLQKLQSQKMIFGVPAKEFKQAMQAVYNGDAAAFSRDVMRGMAGYVPGKANQDAWKTHLSGSSFAVLYPR